MTVERSIHGISYTLKRNRGQRNLRLHLDSAGHVVVSAPYYASYKEIDDFVTRSSDWISKYSQRVSSHDYQTGDFVPYLGRKLTLMVIEGKRAGYDLVDDKVIVTVRKQDEEAVKKVIRKLYTDTVMGFLERRIPYWCSEIGVEEPKVFQVNRAKSKWGVCYTVERRICLSYMCATLPEDLIDMTILHECCHLRYSGHGREFWSLMKANMPDLDERKARLSTLTKSGWAMNIV